MFACDQKENKKKIIYRMCGAFLLIRATAGVASDTAFVCSGLSSGLSLIGSNDEHFEYDHQFAAVLNEGIAFL